MGQVVVLQVHPEQRAVEAGRGLEVGDVEAELDAGHGYSFYR